MTTSALRKQIHKAVDNIQDARLLKTVYGLLSKKQKKLPSLKPMTIEELCGRYERADRDVKAGRTIRLEEVRRRYAKRNR